MAVTLENLPRLEYALSQKGTIYSKTETLVASGVSNVIMLPVNKIYAIGVQIKSGDTVTIEATMAGQAEIEAETAIWDTWDGSAAFNNAVTAIKATNTNESGTGTFTITVKGDI